MVNKEFVLIIAEGCDGCEEAKKAVGDKVRIMDVTKSREAARIAESLDIRAVPVLIEIDHDNNRACITNKKGVFCIDFNVKAIL